MTKVPEPQNAFWRDHPRAVARDAWSGMRNWFIRTEPRSLAKVLDNAVGDDTPAPTVQWTVGWRRQPGTMVRGLFRDGEHVPLSEVANILNRAETTPDLTAQVEAGAQALYEEAWPGRTPWIGAGGDAQGLYRRRARTALAAAAALLVRSAQNDTDDG